GARQIIKSLDPTRREVVLHRLHQGEIFLQGDRHPGGFELMKKLHKHGRLRLRRSAGTSALESLVCGIVQLPASLGIFASLVRFLASKPPGGRVERPSYRVEYLSGGQVGHCEACSIIAQRRASCTTSGTLGARSAISTRVASELSWIAAMSERGK